jgi:hypothetical protein
MPLLLGTAPNQVPTNADLGTMAFQDAKSVTIEALNTAKDVSINGITVGKGGGSLADNTAVGAYTLTANTTGYYQTAVGSAALNANTTGANNTGVGFQALLNNTTGNNNTGVGYSAGSALSTGSQNVILGSYTGGTFPISGTGSGYIVLSDGGGLVRQYFNGANAFFSGTISPLQAATLSAPAYVKGAMYFDTTLNKLRIGGATAWETVTST